MCDAMETATTCLQAVAGLPFPEISAVRSDWLTRLGREGFSHAESQRRGSAGYLFCYYYCSVADSVCVCVGATVHVRVSQRCSASLFFFPFFFLAVIRRVLAPPFVFL